MKKTNFFKIVMTLFMAFLVTGAFAQTSVTVLNFDGTAATTDAPTLHEINAGVEGPALGTAASNVITAGLTDGAKYAVYNDAAGTERTTFIWATADGDITVRTHTVAFSQDGDYEQNAEEVYQTAGATFGLYVDPDPVYSPSYSGTGNVGTGVQWTWTFPGGIGTGSVTSGDDANTSNYVEFASPTVGNYDVTVVETNSALGCNDAGQSIRVNVLVAPTAQIEEPATPANTWAGTTSSICNDAVSEDLLVTITETGVPASLAAYAYSVEKRVINIDASDTEIGSASTSTLVDHTIASKYKMGIPIADGANETVATGAMPVVNNQRTKYTFTLKGSSDAGSDGIVSAISHKSDYIDVPTAMTDPASVTVYAFNATLNSVTYIVNPAPQTGPIYHIPNNFAY